jgi:threonine aldolase
VTSIADFRSDTLTKPDAAMREAMANAEVGDDVFGEDPTVAKLESLAAEFLGKEAALFVPSGTMANQIAIHVHCRPGDELIGEERSHVLLYEAGGLARWSGTTAKTLYRAGGFLDPADVSTLLRADDPHCPRSKLLLIENTHNMSGGRTIDRVAMDALCSAARSYDLLVHIDGARIANAAVANGCEARELTAAADSVSLCFSKGLGAPVGSVVAGSTDFIYLARRTRKALGGGMRQAGIIAAAAIEALRSGPARLAVDHARARKMAEGLMGVSPFELDLDAVQTNILMVEVPGRDPKEVLNWLEDAGIKAMIFGPHLLRFVFHRDLTDEHINRCVARLRSFAVAAT